MSNSEAVQPPSYDELFTGFTGMVALRGVVHHGPLDSVFEPGRDGTVTPNGEQVTGYDYTIPEAELPQAIRDKGINRLRISSYSSAIVGDEIWNERVSVCADEDVGLERTITLTKDEKSGQITTELFVEAGDSPGTEAKDGLTGDQRDEIIEDLFNGRDFWLYVDGPAGDAARNIHLWLTSSREVGSDDIELLRDILRELTQ